MMSKKVKEAVRFVALCVVTAGAFYWSITAPPPVFERHVIAMEDE